MSRLPTAAFTVQMLAARWGTSDTFVYDQIKAGRLPAFKLGGKLIRIRPEAVEQYEQNGAVESARGDLGSKAGTAGMPDPERPSAASLARLVRSRADY